MGLAENGVPEIHCLIITFPAKLVLLGVYQL